MSGAPSETGSEPGLELGSQVGPQPGPEFGPELGTEQLRAERDALATELARTRVLLEQTRAEMEQRAAANRAAVDSLSDAVSTLASRAREASTAQAELRQTRTELTSTSDALDEANSALVEADRNLETRIARRTAELAAANVALLRSEARIQAALDAGRLGAWELDLNADTAERSPLHDRIFGYPDMLPRWGYRALLRHILPEDRHRVHLAFRDTVASKRSQRLHVECRIRRAGDAAVRWIEAFANPLRDADGRVTHLIGVVADVTDRKRAEERTALLLGELNHRVKNTLATVQSVAMQTWRGTASPEEMRESFSARLLALARAHDLLTRGAWDGAGLREVVEQTMGAYGTERVRLDGPAIHLPPSAVVPINLAFHELATNAAKYGALSLPGGRVSVAWKRQRGAENWPVLHLFWTEAGGPPVAEPERRGFGSRLLERGLAQEFGGEVVLEFAPDGLRCRMVLPLRRGAVERPSPERGA